MVVPPPAGVLEILVPVESGRRMCEGCWDSISGQLAGMMTVTAFLGWGDPDGASSRPFPTDSDPPARLCSPTLLVKGQLAHAPSVVGRRDCAPAPAPRAGRRGVFRNEWAWRASVKLHLHIPKFESGALFMCHKASFFF